LIIDLPLPLSWAANPLNYIRAMQQIEHCTKVGQPAIATIHTFDGRQQRASGCFRSATVSKPHENGS
jgi:hypothetical protein